MKWGAVEEEQLLEFKKIRKVWDACTKGVDAAIIARALNKVTLGIDWTGSPKVSMLPSYMGNKSATKPLGDAERKDFHRHLSKELELERARINKKLETLEAANRKAGDGA